MTARRNHALLSALAGALAFAAATVAWAQYPQKPVRIIVPFPPGGLTDVSARVIAANMGGFGQQVIVENRPGGNTLIGARAVVEAAPDGYTIGYVASSIVQSPATSKAWDIDPVRQFAAVTQSVEFPLAIAVNQKKYPAKNLGEFLAEAKANPGKLNFATVTTNGGDVMILKLLARMANAEVVFVNYKGGVASTQATVTGEADAVMVAPQTARPLLAQGGVRLLGVSGPTRFRTLPDVPTFTEAGFPGIGVSSWFGFVAPGGTPREVVQTLHRAIVASLRSPNVERTLLEAGTDLVGNTPQEFSRYIVEQLAMYRRLVAQGLVNVE